MLKNFQEPSVRERISGHLEIIKRYKDGTEEVVVNDHNVIVSGMGVGLVMFFTGSGSLSVPDYQIDRFQVGVSGVESPDASTLFEVSGPLSSVAEDGGDSAELFIEEADQIKNGSITSNSFYGKIPFSHVTRLTATKVRYTIVLDDDAVNDITRDAAGEVPLNEVALFMKNPTGRAGTVASIMVAYRSFSNVIKTTDFALVFRWTLSF